MGNLEAFLDSREGAALLGESSLWFRVADMNGKYLFVSHQAKALLGYTPDELAAIDALELIHPEDREISRIAATALGRGPVETVVRMQRRDGVWAWVQTVVQVKHELIIAVSSLREGASRASWTNVGAFI